MKPSVHIHQMVLRDVGVNLGGGYIHMAQHGLDGAQVRAALEQMGGKRVSQFVWAQNFGDAGFDCRLQSVDVQYTAFNRDGSPQRAELAAVFVEDLEPQKKAKLDRLSSPDLSHRRVVKDGDTLPLLCLEIYGSPQHYLRVAEVNGLDDFRALVPGQALIFPPFERRGEG